MEFRNTEAPSILPIRMLNEYVYCKRLFHLEHVEGRWADNVFTLEGKEVHRRVDKLDHVLPDAESDIAITDQDVREGQAVGSAGDEPPVITRSVPLSSDILGIIGKVDLVSSDGREAVPVETKRGRVPNNEQRSHEPERVQLMAQGLLLREHGYHCDHGVLYFAGSRTRVHVPFTAELEKRTRDYILEASLAAESTVIPEPLDDSPKCAGCSLNAICLPDETSALNDTESHSTPQNIRRFYPMRDDALPFYVQEQGAVIGKSGQSLVVRKEGKELGRIGLKDISQLVLCGNMMVTAQTLHLLCETGIPVVHLSMGHWFSGITYGITLRNAYDRAAQYEVAGQKIKCLEFAKDIVVSKGANQRTMLRRNGIAGEHVLTSMAKLLEKVPKAESLQELLGFEGAIAAHYFRSFGTMLKPRDIDTSWDFESRNRRPPRDPVNTLLSFGYALLAKECTVALLSEGLDPWWGLYHQPRHGRPALALDLMEPFRPVLVDSAVVTAINTGMVRAKDFRTSASGCMLIDSGRKAFIRAYESRLDQLITHPVFEYRCSWRAAIKVQARLLARWMRGDITKLDHIVTR